MPDEDHPYDEEEPFEGGATALSFTAGLLLGAFVGAGVALLFAPQSGRRTRRKLRHTAEDLRGDAEEKLERAADDARRYAARAREAAERSSEILQETVSRGREKLDS